jgi:hypothetical protein
MVTVDGGHGVVGLAEPEQDDANGWGGWGGVGGVMDEAVSG